MIKATATIQVTTMELVIGKPSGLAISTACCGRPPSGSPAAADARLAPALTSMTISEMAAENAFNLRVVLARAPLVATFILAISELVSTSLRTADSSFCLEVIRTRGFKQKRGDQAPLG